MGEFIQGNWKDMIFTGVDAVLTIFLNLGKNLRELASKIWEFLQNPAGGFHVEWTPLLDGFKSTVKALPELVKPELVSMQDEIAAAGERIANRERIRALSIARVAAPAAKPEIAKPEKEVKPAEYKGVAAAELGGAEATSAIARFYNQSTGDAKATAASTKETAKNTKSTVQALKEIANRTQAQAVGLGAFPI
jgi:hypothetical protein